MLRNIVIIAVIASIVPSVSADRHKPAILENPEPERLYIHKPFGDFTALTNQGYGAKNFRDCQEACTTDASCVAFTVSRTSNDNDKTCNLKYGDMTSASISQNNDQDLYYKNTLSRNYTMSPMRNYDGPDITFLDIPKDQCALNCDRTPNCEAFTIPIRNATGCWLKEELPQGTFLKIDHSWNLNQVKPVSQNWSQKTNSVVSSRWGFVNSLNADDCKQACVDTAQCAGFMLVHSKDTPDLTNVGFPIKGCFMFPESDRDEIPTPNDHIDIYYRS